MQLRGADITPGFWRMMVEREGLKSGRTNVIVRSECPEQPLFEGTTSVIPISHRQAFCSSSIVERKTSATSRRRAPQLDSQEKLDLRLWLEALHPEHEWIGRL